MKRSLASKILLVHTVIIIITLSVVSAYIAAWFTDYYQNSQKSIYVNESKSVEKQLVKYYNGEVSQEQLKDTLSTVGAVTNSIVILTDSQGNPTMSTNNSIMAILDKSLITDKLEKLRGGKSLGLGIKRNYFDSKDAYIYLVPMFNGNKFIGALVLNSFSTAISEPFKFILKIVWGSSLIIILISVFVSYFFSRKFIVEPAKIISTTSRKIARGEMDKRVRINTNDEFEEIAESINLMADFMQEADENRREFISNASHELRSPITSIRGFIEGILDGIVPPEKQIHYLTIAHNEIQRLTRLINDLLDLSALESGRVTLKMREFDINEIIHQVLLTLSNDVEEKHINMEVEFETEPTIVLGDKDKLHEVVSNLLDNATKYVVEDGTIRVSVKSVKGKIQVRIYNSGPHIKEDSINKIWERFYKEEKSRTTKKSTGLGLPIVKNIILMHEEEVWVENIKEGGVAFVFTLSRPHY